MTLYERVQELCKINGISQNKLEAELGISNGASYKWKKSSPSTEILIKLSNYFNVSTDFLMMGKENSINNYAFYLDEETADVANEIYRNDRILFDTYKSSNKNRLIAYARKLKELESMEHGDFDI